MSVILKGDVVSNFGTYLSAPYIRKVAIQDDSIVVTFSIFINVEEDQDVNSMISDLDEKLNFYFYVTADPERLESIIDKKVNIFEYYELGSYDMMTADPDTPSEMIVDYSLEFGDYYEKMDDVFDMTSDSDGVTTYDNLSTDSLYDAEGNRVWEFQVQREFTLGYNVDPESVTNTDIAGLWYLFHYENDREGATADTFGLYIGAFSSLVDISTTDELETNLENIMLLNAKTSDISYQIVFDKLSEAVVPYTNYTALEDGGYFPLGAVPSPTQIEFFDSKGAIYDQLPLQSIQSPYYQVDKITHKGIVEYFEELVSEFEERAPHSAFHRTRTKDRMLQKMLNNVSFVLKKYGAKANLLPELNKLKQIFPSKSSATKTGQFYSRFVKRISTINKTIEEGTKLRKKEIRNAKLRDIRQDELVSWELTDDWLTWDSSSNDHKYYLYTNWYITQEFDDTEDILSTYGYWFFDYEKALKKNSYLAGMIDISKLKTLFDIDMPYDFFRIESAWMSRTEDIEYDSSPSQSVSGMVMTSVMDEDVPYPLTDSVTFELTGDAVEQSAGAQILVTPSNAADYDGMNSLNMGFKGLDYYVGFGQNYPTLVVRNGLLRDNGLIEPFSEELPDYRLITFVFEDFANDIQGDETFHRYSNGVTILDRSLEIMNYLVGHYNTALSELADYVELAENACSFNETSEEFNTFFTDGVLAKYEDEEIDLPWYKAPVLYALHRDLLLNSYDGDMEAALEDATTYIMNINPYNGTLEELQNFYTRMETFSINNYDSGTSGNVGYYLENYSEQEIEYEVLSAAWPPSYKTTNGLVTTVEGDSLGISEAVEGSTYYVTITEDGDVTELLNIDDLLHDDSDMMDDYGSSMGYNVLMHYLTYEPSDWDDVTVHYYDSPTDEDDDTWDESIYPMGAGVTPQTLGAHMDDWQDIQSEASILFMAGALNNALDDPDNPTFFHTEISSDRVEGGRLIEITYTTDIV